MFKCKEHDKCYQEGISLTSLPPQRRWICRKCLERGTEIIGNSGVLGKRSEYDDLLDKYKLEKTP